MAQLNPLDWKVPIVDKFGQPTPEFQRKWAQQSRINGTIPTDVSAFLDTLGTTPGDVLLRGATLWALAAPSALLGVGSALKWTTARTLSFTGDATGTHAVDGSADVATALTLATVNANVGSFGDGTHVPVVTVNAKGLVTAASSLAITSAPKWATARTLSWTGDATGSMSVDGSADVSTALTVVQAPKWTTARTLSWTGDATGSGSVDGSANVATALTLANTAVAAGTYGDATHVAQITVDAKGRLTAASAVAISGGGGAGALTKIGSVTTTLGATSITFSAITGSLLDLVFDGLVRSANATGDSLIVQFNGDTAGNYNSSRDDRLGNVTANSTTSIQVAEVNGANSAAGMAAGFEGVVPAYATTTFNKIMTAHQGFSDGTNTLTERAIGMWKNTAAITSVTFKLTSGAAFVTGSMVNLYGRG